MGQSDLYAYRTGHASVCVLAHSSRLSRDDSETCIRGMCVRVCSVCKSSANPARAEPQGPLSLSLSLCLSVNVRDRLIDEQKMVSRVFISVCVCVCLETDVAPAARVAICPADI